MENKNPEMVEIIWDEAKTHFKFKCRVCDCVWYPNIQTGGELAQISWQCPNGCKLKDLKGDKS